jgi:DNA-binding NtrC family response regulator
VLEHAVAMAEGPVVEADELHLLGDGPSSLPEGLSLNLRELEAWAIRQALKQTGGVATKAAEILGIHRDTLAEKMKLYSINRNAV